MKVIIFVLIFGYLNDLGESQKRGLFKKLSNIFFFFIIIDKKNFNAEGDRCRRQDRSYGVCKRLRDCPKAETDYRLHTISPEFCDFSLVSQIICCPETTDNEIHLNDRASTHRTQKPSLDSLLRDTGLNYGLNTNYNSRDYTTTSRTTTTRAMNQNNYNDNANRNKPTTKTTTTTRRTTAINNNYQLSGIDRNGRRTPTHNADDLFDEAYLGQPTMRPDRPKRRDGPRISFQSKCLMEILV